MMKRLLITGAAGALGGECRRRCAHLAEIIRVSDIADLGPAGPNEEVVQCDLSDAAAMMELTKDCDAILHFGGKAYEGTWDVVRNSNIEGMYNLYESARQNGIKRIFFASSIHAVGYSPVTGPVDPQMEICPDSLYGASKAFGEALARMYYHKFGIESICVRIASCLPQPVNHRNLATWFSYDDLVSLVERVFTVPVLGCPIMYGVSGNDRKWADNSDVDFLGWKPQDNAEAHRQRIAELEEMPSSDSPDFHFIGGPFVTFGIMQDDGSQN